MKKYLAAGILLVLLLLAGFYYLYQRGGNAYRGLVPSDARVVAVLNTKELLKAADLSLRDILAILHASADEQTGLRLLSPVYGFVTPREEKGFATAVASKKKVEKWLTLHGMNVESDKGYQWASSGDWLLAFDKNRLLAMTSSQGNTHPALRELMLSLLSEESSGNPLVVKAEEQEGILGAATFLDDAFLRHLGVPRAFIPALFEGEEVVQCASLSMEENVLKLIATVQTDNNSLREVFDALSEIASPLTDNLPSFLPEDPAISVRMNLEGESLLPLLRKNPKLRTALLALNLVIDADMMIRSIAGDVQMTIPEYPSEESEWLFTAKLSDTSFLSNLSHWSTGLTSYFVKFQALSDTDFYISTADLAVYFGVRNDRLYVTPSSTLSGIACVENPQPDPQYSIQPESRLYAQFDVSMLEQLLLSSEHFSSARMPLSSLLSIADNLTMNVFDGPRAELQLNCHQPLSEWLKSIVMP